MFDKIQEHFSKCISMFAIWNNNMLQQAKNLLVYII